MDRNKNQIPGFYQLSPEAPAVKNKLLKNYTKFIMLLSIIIKLK